jgi:hypothetical protein
MSNTRRIPFVLNIDDPVDAAIWDALEPMLERRRASAFIRGAVAHALGIGGLLAPVGQPDGRQHWAALGSSTVPRAQRPGKQQTSPTVPLGEMDTADVDEAANNFLSQFG